MDMTGYLGKKVDLVCTDGKQLAGYVFDVAASEDSDIECDSVDIALIDSMAVIVLPIEDISSIVVDPRYREFDFRS